MTKEEIDAEIKQLQVRIEDAEDRLTSSDKKTLDERTKLSAEIEKWRAMVWDMERAMD